MKKIEAIIQPQRFEAVKNELLEAGITRMTVLDAEGFGRQQGKKEIFRGHEYEINLVNKVYIILVVNDDMVLKAKEAIIKGARTGRIGDGKIFISTVEEVIRIRTGEINEDAI